MCFVKPDGSQDFWRDDDVQEFLRATIKPETKFLGITDCCHAATNMDISKNESLRGYSMMHISATRDFQTAVDFGNGGLFTSALLETVSALSLKKYEDYSVGQLFNEAVSRYGKRYKSLEQNFACTRALGFDIDTFMWPLIPEKKAFRI